MKLDFILGIGAGIFVGYMIGEDRPPGFAGGGEPCYGMTIGFQACECSPMAPMAPHGTPGCNCMGCGGPDLRPQRQQTSVSFDPPVEA
jgi:hypothetical protein